MPKMSMKMQAERYHITHIPKMSIDGSYMSPNCPASGGAEGVGEHEARVHAAQDHLRQAQLDHDVFYVSITFSRDVVRGVLDPRDKVDPGLHAHRDGRRVRHLLLWVASA